MLSFTKDADFLELLKRFGSPPKIIWVTCGNTSNKKFQEILSKHIENIKKIVDEGENLIEISD
jgi:predicted nuclease of predicted toxin-antitoxin system